MFDTSIAPALGVGAFFVASAKLPRLLQNPYLVPSKRTNFLAIGLLYGYFCLIHQTVYLMRFSLFACLGALVLIALCYSCSGDQNQNAFPKQLPVDKRAEQQQEAVRQAQTDENNLQQWKEERKTLDALLDNEARYYAVRDGDGGFVAESTTFYKEESKTTPIKTQIIYLTGDSDQVYWLKDNVVWVERSGLDFIYKGQTLAFTLQDGAVIESTQSDQNDAAKVPPLARRLLQLPAANLE